MKRKTLTLLPLNLQFFAADSGSDGASDSSKDGDGAGAANNDGGNSDEDGQGEDGAGEKKTFDDILADASYQAEFDRRVQKAINRLQYRMLQQAGWMLTQDRSFIMAVQK